MFGPDDAHDEMGMLKMPNVKTVPITKQNVSGNVSVKRQTCNFSKNDANSF